MGRRILVPLDGTPLGEAVLPQVSELARALDALVELIHVVPPSFRARRESVRRPPPQAMFGAPTVLPDYSPSSTVLQYQFDPKEIESNRSYVGRVAEWLRSEGLKAEVVVVEGADVADEVLRRSEGADMLAFAAWHGHVGLNVGRLVFGSISERLLHEARVPVLIVRVPHAAG